MAGKGPVDTVIDTGALNELIVYAGQYKADLDDAAREIIELCKKMEEEESLKGGDGDAIRENFREISKMATNLMQSVNYIHKVLNDKLGNAINMRHGQTVGDSSEAIKKAASKTGVMKKE